MSAVLPVAAKGKLILCSAAHLPSARRLGFYAGSPECTARVRCEGGFRTVKQFANDYVGARELYCRTTRRRGGGIDFEVPVDGEWLWVHAKGPWELVIERKGV